jgi:hypothetical protein
MQPVLPDGLKDPTFHFSCHRSAVLLPTASAKSTASTKLEALKTLSCLKQAWAMLRAAAAMQWHICTKLSASGKPLQRHGMVTKHQSKKAGNPNRGAGGTHGWLQARPSSCKLSTKSDDQS